MNNEITFWEFINDNRIVIPIVQRDYAQGREEKKNLRENFLRNLRQALDGTLPDNEKTLKLDFVYGSRTDDRLKPLDGQQRLTTLWLLHWFIAYKAETLDDIFKDGITVRKQLERFTYETRLSSSEFCRTLCRERLRPNTDDIRKHLESDKSDKSDSRLRDDKLRTLFVSELIERQTWFYSRWKQDPTIRSMLRMLSGTPENPDDPEDIVDGMEELFIECGKEDFKRYWESLKSPYSPIVFYQLPMKDYDLTDDLYIKMNARGKQLTGYENFKADLINYISEHADKERKQNVSEGSSDNRWQTLLDAQNGIPVNLDNAWSDLFWQKPEEGKQWKYRPIDNTMFAFFNRFFLVYYLDRLGDESNPYYKYLNQRTAKKDKEPISYQSFSNYFFDKQSVDYSLLQDMSLILNRFSLLDKEPDYCGLNFSFIPQYATETGNDKALVINQFTQIQMVVMAAVMQYFKEGTYDKSSFDDWMRVVRNLVSIKSGDGGDVIRSVGEMGNAVRVLRLLDSHNVYDSLCDLVSEDGQTFVKDVPKSFIDQLAEEVTKARRILDRDGLVTTIESPDWRQSIHEAEDYSFFNGAIRFLFRNAENRTDWNDFALRFANAKKIFRVFPTPENALSVDESDPGMLKALYSRLTTEEFGCLRWARSQFLFNNSTAAWRYYLLEGAIARPVDELLKEENLSVLKLSDSDIEWGHYLYLLSQTGLLDYVLDPENKNKYLRQSWIRFYHYYTALYPSSTGIYLNARNRDNFLAATPGITVDSSIKIKDCELLYGQNVNFDYTKDDTVYHFQWRCWERPDEIVLLDDETGEPQRDPSAPADTPRYYSFSAHGIEDHSEILKQLDLLIGNLNAAESDASESDAGNPEP